MAKLSRIFYSSKPQVVRVSEATNNTTALAACSSAKIQPCPREPQAKPAQSAPPALSTDSGYHTSTSLRDQQPQPLPTVLLMVTAFSTSAHWNGCLVHEMTSSSLPAFATSGAIHMVGSNTLDDFRSLIFPAEALLGSWRLQSVPCSRW